MPLTDEVLGALALLRRRGHHVAPDDLVFLGSGGAPVEDSRLRRRFYETLDRARLPHMRFHDLRHTFGTLAVQAFPLSDVAAYMGHADIQTTMIYVHHIPKADAAARLSQVLSNDDGVARPTKPLARRADFTDRPEAFEAHGLDYAPGRNRTCDAGLRRAALYPLSYRGS